MLRCDEMIDLLINKTEKFSLSKNIANTRLMFIFNRPDMSPRPLIESYEMNDLDWKSVKHVIFKEFNQNTDILLGIVHTEEGTRMYLLDHNAIKRKIESRKGRKNEPKS